MSRSAELSALLAEIAKARTPAARLAVAARLAQRIRALSRKVRLEIGKQMGTGWLRRRFEQLFDDDRVVTDLEQTALATASEIENMSVDEITGLANDLRVGRTGSLGDRVRAVLEKAGATPLEDPDPSEDEEPEPAPEAEPPPVPEPEPEAEPATEAEPEPPRVEQVPLVPPPTPRPLFEDEPEVELEEVAAEALDIDESAGTFEILRALERHPEKLRGLGRDGRAALIDRVGAGWPAWRALASLARANAIESTEEAIALMGMLPSDRDRTWCLDDLSEHFDPEALLVAFDNEKTRARLRTRLVQVTT